MISLKKHIDNWSGTADDPALKACRALLMAAAETVDRAVPDLGPNLERKLSELADSLAPPVTPETFAHVSKTAKSELSEWAEQAYLRHEASKRDLRQIVELMTRAISSVTERDKRYAQEVGDLTKKLRAIAGITNLAAISRALLESASSLNACVERIAEDGRQSLHQLSAEVEDYRSRLVKSERLSAVDPLTGLANRRAFEEHLNLKIQARARFCLVLIDLNGFKEINDRFGHLAGDDVLKHFAAKLRLQFPSADLVARWGGDEFAVIIASNHRDAQARVDRIRRSALGDCRINVGAKPVMVPVDASFGVVEWNGSEGGAEMLARADHYMYLGKESLKAAQAEGQRPTAEVFH